MRPPPGDCAREDILVSPQPWRSHDARTWSMPPVPCAATQSAMLLGKHPPHEHAERVAQFTVAGAWTMVSSSALQAGAVTALQRLLRATPLQVGAAAHRFGAAPSWPLHFVDAERGLLWVPTPFATALWGAPAVVTAWRGAPMACAPCTATLWEHPVPQVQAADVVVAQLTARRRAFGVGAVRLVMPCGAGKTIVACSIMRRLGVVALVLVHRVFLVQQWVERLCGVLPGVRIAVYSGTAAGSAATRRALAAACAAHPGTHVAVVDTPWDPALHAADVVVATVDTVGAREVPPVAWRRVGALLLDEAHHVSAKSFADVTAAVPAALRLSVTATPRRKDGLQKEMAWLSGPIVFRAYRRPQRVPVTVLHVTGGTATRRFKPPSAADKRRAKREGVPPEDVYDAAATALAVAQDAPRNACIAGAVASLVLRGYDVLVAVRRVPHMRVLQAAIEAAVAHYASKGAQRPPGGTIRDYAAASASSGAGAGRAAAPASQLCAMPREVLGVHPREAVSIRKGGAKKPRARCATKRQREGGALLHAAGGAVRAAWRVWHAAQCPQPCPLPPCALQALGHGGQQPTLSPRDVMRCSPLLDVGALCSDVRDAAAEWVAADAAVAAAATACEAVGDPGASALRAWRAVRKGLCAALPHWVAAWAPNGVPATPALTGGNPCRVAAALQEHLPQGGASMQAFPEGLLRSTMAVPLREVPWGSMWGQAAAAPPSAPEAPPPDLPTSTRVAGGAACPTEQGPDAMWAAPLVGCVHGGSTPLDRAVAFESRVLLATQGLLGEGFDCPRFRALVMADDHTGIEQLVGRVLRPPPKDATWPSGAPPPPCVVDVPREHGSASHLAARKREYRTMSMPVAEVEVHVGATGEECAAERHAPEGFPQCWAPLLPDPAVVSGWLASA